MTVSVKVDDLYKKYTLYKDKKDRLLDLIVPHKEYGDAFYALQNVSFEVQQGDIVGLIGINGSGKSTLANLLAGIIPPTSGEIETIGQVALIAVSAGLDNQLTGRENIELKLLMLGFTKKQIQEMEESIIEFAELERFIDQPVKMYSSGMKSRLGFAISVQIDPDILIIDEALSVGDKSFAEKSFNKMLEFKESGKTMFFVSHSISQMRKFCEKVIWIEYGGIREIGDSKEVLVNYESFLDVYSKWSSKEKETYRKECLEKRLSQA